MAFEIIKVLLLFSILLAIISRRKKPQEKKEKPILGKAKVEPIVYLSPEQEKEIKEKNLFKEVLRRIKEAKKNG